MNYVKAFGCDEKLELSDEQCNEIRKAASTLDEIYSFETKYDLVAGNYYDLQKNVLEKSLYNSLFYSAGRVTSFFQNDREMNRLLFNFLSGSKLYIDQIKPCITIINNTLLKEVNQKIDEFEKNESNKLMIALRNHMQHCGISCNLLSGFKSKDIAKIKEKYLFYYTTLILDVETFMKNSKNKNEFGEKITSKSKIEVFDYLSKFFENLLILHSDIRILLKKDKDQSIKIIKTLYETYTKKTGYQFDLVQELMQFFVNDNMKDTLTTNTIKLISELENKNLLQTNAKIACNASLSQLNKLIEG